MKTTIYSCVVAGVAVAAAAAGWAQPASSSVDPNAMAHLQKLGNRGIRVHDPSTIVKCKDEYWIFCTGRGTPSYRSKDLVTWERGPQTFTKSPEWVAQAVPGNRGGLGVPNAEFRVGRPQVPALLLRLNLRQEYLGDRTGHERDAGPVRPRL